MKINNNAIYDIDTRYRDNQDHEIIKKQIDDMESQFRKELEVLLNKHSMETGSCTPDFILAEYLNNVLQTFDTAVIQRQRWYNKGDEVDTQQEIPFPSAEDQPLPKDWKQEILDTDFGDKFEDLSE